MTLLPLELTAELNEYCSLSSGGGIEVTPNLDIDVDFDVDFDIDVDAT